jgi:transposase
MTRLGGASNGALPESAALWAAACNSLFGGPRAGARSAVLRLLRGESLDLLARETGQPAGRIAGWREEFLQAGREGLKSRPRPEDDRRLVAAQRKVGELQLEFDILRALLEKKGSPLSPRRSR